MDIRSIAVNLATRYASLTPPTGEEAIRESTADPPQTITKTPFVLVSLAQRQAATFTYGASLRKTDSGGIPFWVDFFLDKASDLARTEVRIQKWYPILLDATLTGVHLGLPALVANCWAGQVETGDLTYGGSPWAAIRLTVGVVTSEGIAPTA